MYDYEEEQPELVKPVIQKQKAPESQKTQAPEQESSFNFDMYDDEAVEQSSKPKNRSKNPFETAPVSKEEYAKMSISEKIQYAKDLEKEQRYRSSQDLTKNIASGLSFGYTEGISGLERSEDEDPAAALVGQVIGSAIPIGGAAKLASYPVKAAVAVLPKILQPLGRFMQAFGTGALYETGKQGANVAQGKEFETGQIPLTGAAFAALDGLLHGGTLLGRKFLGMSPAHQASLLEKQIIPEDLPRSQYETAEEVLNLLRENKIPSAKNLPKPRDDTLDVTSGSISGLKNRVQADGKDIGLRPITKNQEPHLSDSVGDVFSQEKFFNTTQGGRALKNEISNIDEDVYRGVNEMYKYSKELNSNIENIQPQLVNKLEDRIDELVKIPEPSDVQKRLIRASKNVLKNLVQYENIVDEAGNVIGKEISGYKPINNQTLIDQVQSLRQIIDYDFAHGNTKNIFRPLINDLQDAAIRSAEEVGQPEAAQALSEARHAYKTWVEAFDNDYIRPFRDASNKDFSKLFKSSLDFDESNMIRNILKLSPDGERMANASVREIVEKNLNKYLENPRAAKGPEFDKAMRELQAVITPEQAVEVRNMIHKAQGRPPFRARSTPARALTNEEKIAAKYVGKEPEDIQNMMNTRSGIRKLREDLNTPQKQEAFNTLQQQKMRSVLREGNIEKEFTGDELYKFLNKEKNYEIFSEILGETETEALRLSAKEIGKQQVKKEMFNKSLKKAVHHTAAMKSLQIILSIL